MAEPVEVYQDGPIVLGALGWRRVPRSKHDVARGDVAVDERVRVEIGDGLEEAPQHTIDLDAAQRAALDALVQCAAGEALHDEERALVAPIEPEHARHAVMGQPVEEAGAAGEQLVHLPRVQWRVLHHLDHRVADALAMRRVDARDPASVELLAEAEFARDREQARAVRADGPGLGGAVAVGAGRTCGRRRGCGCALHLSL